MSPRTVASVGAFPLRGLERQGRTSEMKLFSTTRAPAGAEAEPAEGQAMRAYWDEKARENAMFFIRSTLDYANTDEAVFWASGPDTLDRTLEPFSRAIGPTDRVIEI